MHVARLFWSDGLSGATTMEPTIAAVVRGYERDSTAIIAPRIAGDAVYRQSGAVRTV